mmetsp:Transcript_27446/g.48916  ORF Transcript_27446/g.48916 Transcript_27446/m.48916 type:complete len:614 (-) Transcript_27446:155-1996(-)
MACAASVTTGSVAGEALQRVHRSDILYAYSMVASRAFAVPFPNDAAPLCLIPLVDMLDHSPTVKVEYATSKGEEGKGAGGGTFSLIAKSSQPEGQPLWINYGSCKANSELLIQHGFAVPDNPSDSFSSNLRIRSPDGAAPATDLAIILRSAGLKPQQQLSLANPLPAAMLHVLALLHLPPQCAYFLAARCLEPTNTTNPSEPGTPRFPASGDTSGFPASPLHRLSRDGGLDVVVSVGSPRNNKRPTPAAPTHGRRPLSPLFSSVLLLPSFGSDDLPLPLVRAVATTLTRLLRHELERCEVAAGAEGMPSAATVSTTGSADPFEAMALFLQGQVDILRASLETAVAWEERMSSKAAFVSAAPEAVSGGPLATSDLGLWHELHLQVPPEREQLLKLSEVGTHHWLPLLPDMDSEEEEEPTGAATAVPSTVPFACWNRLLTAATVCGAELPLLERCGAPALLSCAAQVETATAGPSLFSVPPELAAAVTNQVQAAAEAFRAGLEHLPYLTEQGLSSPDTAKHDAAKSPEVLLHELLQDELAQVERWRKEVQADYLLLAAAGKECTGGEVQEAKEELQQLTDSVTVLKSWTFRLDRITRLQKKSTLLNPRKRRRTVG